MNVDWPETLVVERNSSPSLVPGDFTILQSGPNLDEYEDGDEIATYTLKRISVVKKTQALEDKQQ